MMINDNRIYILRFFEKHVHCWFVAHIITITKMFFTI